MTEAEQDKFTANLKEFSSRLDARLHDFRERGEFTDVHRTLTEEIERRHDQIQKKLALAEANGTAWDVIRSEMERDFSSLLDDLQQAIEQLDADQMKSK